MWQINLLIFYFFITVNVQITNQAKKAKTSLITDIQDIKEFKKLLKTKSNVMVLYLNEQKKSNHVIDIFKETAELMKGQASLVVFNCYSGDQKKICKKMKVDDKKNYFIKHYKDGEFHKDYDRSISLNSLGVFLRDPTGDLPWDEDPSATSIHHLQDYEALSKLLKKGAAVYKKVLVMFYAPWCGYCKILKPDYVQAAEDLKGEAILAAIDVAKQGNSKVRQMYNITGFPTLLYFEKGQYRFPYNGENRRDSIVSFVKDPFAQVQKLKEVVDESWSDDSDVVHLTAADFDSTLAKTEHALVAFYAPWCGHCKRIKPEFEKAAARIKKEKINGILGAVDATKEPDLASRFEVKGYPTLKYFNKGEFKYDAGHARQEEQIVTFIKDPKEPPPPPPPEKPWSEEESSVRHLDESNFKSVLKKIKHSIVMFYAPWCGHCKITKPEFVKAAESFADELLVAFCAVDCTVAKSVCGMYDVKGYPTLKYFSYFDKTIQDYDGGRKKLNFESFIRKKMAVQPYSAAPKTNQEAGFGANVVLATDATIFGIMDSPKLSFIMFYASWCGHCVTIKPAVSKLATLCKNENICTVVAIDAAENPKVADAAGIETLPTFKVYTSGKFIAEFTEERNYDNLLAFVKKHKARDEL